MTDFDVIVLGGGPRRRARPALHVAWRRAARGSLIVERELLGGECSYWGCIPSKTLVRPGEALQAARVVVTGRARGGRRQGGCPLNSPNDVVVKGDGTVWFTDPSYGYLQGFRPAPRLGDFVYRHDPATGDVDAAAAFAWRDFMVSARRWQATSATWARDPGTSRSCARRRRGSPAPRVRVGDAAYTAARRRVRVLGSDPVRRRSRACESSTAWDSPRATALHLEARSRAARARRRRRRPASSRPGAGRMARSSRGHRRRAPTTSSPREPAPLYRRARVPLRVDPPARRSPRRWPPTASPAPARLDTARTAATTCLRSPTEPSCAATGCSSRRPSRRAGVAGGIQLSVGDPSPRGIGTRACAPGRAWGDRDVTGVWPLTSRTTAFPAHLRGRAMAADASACRAPLGVPQVVVVADAGGGSVLGVPTRPGRDVHVDRQARARRRATAARAALRGAGLRRSPSARIRACGAAAGGAARVRRESWRRSRSAARSSADEDQEFPTLSEVFLHALALGASSRWRHEAATAEKSPPQLASRSARAAAGPSRRDRRPAVRRRRRACRRAVALRGRTGRRDRLRRARRPRAADPLGPGDVPNRTYDVVPHAEAVDFDDSGWEPLAPQDTHPAAVDGTCVLQLVPHRGHHPGARRRLRSHRIDGRVRDRARRLRRGVGRRHAAARARRQRRAGRGGLQRPQPRRPHPRRTTGRSLPARRVRHQWADLRVAAQLHLDAHATLDFYAPERARPAEIVRSPEDIAGPLEQVAGGFEFTEGPVWSPDGALLFSSPNTNAIYRWTRAGRSRCSVPRAATPASTSGASPAGIQRADVRAGWAADDLPARQPPRAARRPSRRHDRDRRPLRRRRLNCRTTSSTPPTARCYFTDPPFGLPDVFDDPGGSCRSPASSRARRRGHLITDELAGPNGLAFSPDERYLYVGNWDIERKVIMRYALDEHSSAPGDRCATSPTSPARTPSTGSRSTRPATSTRADPAACGSSRPPASASA